MTQIIFGASRKAKEDKNIVKINRDTSFSIMLQQETEGGPWSTYSIFWNTLLPKYNCVQIDCLSQIDTLDIPQHFINKF